MQITMHLLLVQLLKTKTPWLVCGLGHSVLAPRLINKQNLRCAAQAFSIVCFEKIKIGKVHPEGLKKCSSRPTLYMDEILFVAFCTCAVLNPITENEIQ